MRWLSSKNRVVKATIIAVTIGLVFTLAFTANIAGSSFTSDDVAQQAMTHDLTKPGPHTLLLEVDTYVSKIPVYLVFNALTQPSRAQLILESLLFNLIMIILLLVWWRKIAPKKESSWLVFIWLLTTGVYWMSQTVNPNTRNVDIMLMLLFGLFAVQKVVAPPTGKKPLVLYIILSSVLAGALVFEDLFFLFFILVPLFVAIFIYWYKEKKRLPLVVAGLVLTIGLAVYVSLTVIFAHFGLSIGSINQLRAASGALVHPGHLPSKIIQILNSYLGLLGASPSRIRSNYWLLPGGIANFAVICLAISSVYHLMRSKLSLLNLWLLLIIGVTFGYVAITGLNVPYTFQYFIVLIPITALFVALAVQRLGSEKSRYYRPAILIITASVLLNVTQGAGFIVQSHKTGKPNELDYQIISSLNKNGITKSYGNYWVANISYYLSDYKDNVLPTACLNGRTYQYPTLLDTRRFNSPSKRVGLIVSTDLTGIPGNPYPITLGCTVNEAIDQFGIPQKIIHIVPSVNLLIYRNLENKTTLM